jgi:hypothetical protein
MQPAAIHHEFIIINHHVPSFLFHRAGARTTPRININTRPGPNRMARTTTPEAKPAAVWSRTRRPKQNEQTTVRSRQPLPLSLQFREQGKDKNSRTTPTAVLEARTRRPQTLPENSSLA